MLKKIKLYNSSLLKKANYLIKLFLLTNILQYQKNDSRDCNLHYFNKYH